MMVVRGGLGIVLGATILLRSAVGVGDLVMLFGMYALLDGMAAAAWATRVSHRLAESWPVLLEGIFSAGLGVFALVKPFQAAPFAHVVALWALVTGILEILAARLPREAGTRWPLAAGGVWSIFVAVFVLSLPYALTEHLVTAIGVYVLVFGIVVFLSYFTFGRPTPKRRPVTPPEVFARIDPEGP